MSDDSIPSAPWPRGKSTAGLMGVSKCSSSSPLRVSFEGVIIWLAVSLHESPFEVRTAPHSAHLMPRLPEGGER